MFDKSDRIHHPGLREKVMSAAEAAEFIQPGDAIGFSGFTGAGYPKEVPEALAHRIGEAHQRGDSFPIRVFTGASTASELDGVLAKTGEVIFRAPYQSDPAMRAKINEGVTNYVDLHLSHSAAQVAQGFLGPINIAVVEAAQITKTGGLVPTSSVGNTNIYLDKAEKIIVEVNEWQSADLAGMHDIWSPGVPPNRQIIPLTEVGQRIGSTEFEIDVDKVVAVVYTNAADRNAAFTPIDETSHNIAGHFVDFLEHEIRHGRIPQQMLPLQSGVGNMANAVLAGLAESGFTNLKSYTEVIQDEMINLLDAGVLSVASATSFALSPDYAEQMNRSAADYAKKIVLRPQEISNNPEVIRRLGVVACNGMVEADIYGNVNSTHVGGTRMLNGIGGSGDFTRNAYISTFVSPSVAKGGAVSSIVPMVSHTDHTEHDTMIIVTEQGLADLRGLAPRQRAKVIINNCAHPDFREMLLDYVERAEASGTSHLHTPHDLELAHSWHTRFLETGSMRV
ncbi:acetyl-CoA hydrolase/transferase family protein [Corynebacterium sp. TAE3-ERU12]|uniref:acetyl-CoA hydrolase/transferase family protein n=1 Tax=Corynebacterium sp. TAE3-ERU12 TaxID=2849491 RepID=UPI001C48522C|nr:acetyl-CoA hydrolase/transferase family protein [Corynebacterium sp. TAE3-ERU12]MBV7295162.1 acetyl-CoA hydrolase/transferase family protein [Corynebacterium sp. TAE3-ERU12]